MAKTLQATGLGFQHSGACKFWWSRIQPPLAELSSRQLFRFWRAAFAPTSVGHILNATTPEAAREITRPDPSDCTPRLPISLGNIVWSKGLFDVFHPHLWVACPCVFKPTGWALHPLLAREHLRAFNIPLDMDKALPDASRERLIRSVIQWSLMLLGVTAGFRAMETDTGGGCKGQWL
jgi:hypothetical protein